MSITGEGKLKGLEPNEVSYSLTFKSFLSAIPDLTNKFALYYFYSTILTSKDLVELSSNGQRHIKGRGRRNLRKGGWGGKSRKCTLTQWGLYCW